MFNQEVERLRHLRATALRIRAVARALEPRPPQPLDSVMNRGGCVAWRVARVVSGRLRAHPFASFQKDAGIGVLIANSLVAANASFGVKTRQQRLVRFNVHLRTLARELSDVRALTGCSELSDSFGRAQIEIRALLLALAHETDQAGAGVPGVQEAVPVESDWPYLAF